MQWNNVLFLPGTATDAFSLLILDYLHVCKDFKAFMHKQSMKHIFLKSMRFRVNFACIVDSTTQVTQSLAFMK